MDILFPVDEGIERLDTREIHQLLRELTTGVYSLNAQPVLTLEANFDLTSTCQLPTGKLHSYSFIHSLFIDMISLAYIDTRLGQIMINCDAWLKSVWHGVFMSREKRAKFVDRWRLIAEPSITRSVTYEFEAAGMSSILSIHE